MSHATHSTDFYAVLQIPPDASLSDIKIAYRHTLLRLHPDKQQLRSRAAGFDKDVDVVLDGATPTASLSWPCRPSPMQEESVDVALLKEAYRTLSDVGLRAAYDGSLRRERERSRGPRPAQIVSLDEFATTETDIVLEWRYGCRCGGVYRITEDDLKNDAHLVGCESCSEVVWVGYEVVPEDE